MLGAISGPEAVAITKPCLTLLVNEPAPAAQGTSDQMVTVESWLKQFGEAFNLKDLHPHLERKGIKYAELSVDQLRQHMAELVFPVWQSWAKISDQQRDAASGLELNRINAAPEVGSLILLTDTETGLTRLSQRNFDRMKAHIRKRFPVSERIVNNQRITDHVHSFCQLLIFYYLRNGVEHFSAGTAQPMASPREIKRLGISDPNEELFSQLIQGSPSVGFEVWGSRYGESPKYLNAKTGRDKIALSMGLAKEHGYFLPAIKNLKELFTFFSFWDTSALQELLDTQRYSFPSHVQNVNDLLRYLDNDKAKLVFSRQNMFSQLAPLRTRLGQYVLTEQDGAELFRYAIEHYLLNLADLDPHAFAAIVGEMRVPGGFQNLFNRRVLPFLYLSSMQLRIPVAVSPADYYIMRMDPMAFDPVPDFSGRLQRPSGPPRLDHQSAP